MPANAQKIAQNAVFIANEQRIDKAQFNQDIANYQQRLNSLPAKSHVVLFHQDTYQFAVRLFALARMGHNVVLPPNGQPETLRILLAQTPIFCGDDSLFGESREVVNLEQVVSCPHHETHHDVWPSASAVIFYTSGSSGQSKPIVKPWNVLNRELDVLSRTFALHGRVCFLSTVSHQHIYGLLFRLLWPLANGQVIDSQLIQYPEHIALRLQQLEKAVLISSPAQLARLSTDNVLVPCRERLQWIFSSGGPLSNTHAAYLFKQLARPVTQVYGSTETGGIGYRQVSNEELKVPWQPFSGNRLSIKSDKQLYLDSYILEALNLRLDDSAEVLTNGQFHLLGRVDRTIKIEEKRLNLDELEALLNSHQWVHEARLVVLPSKRTLIGAVVVLTQVAKERLKQDGKLAINKLFQEYLLSHFERVCLPRKWRYIEELPYNSQAKISIKVLEQYFAKPE